MLASELKMKLVNLDQIFLFCQYVVMSNQAPMPRLISFFFFTKGGPKVGSEHEVTFPALLHEHINHQHCTALMEITTEMEWLDRP